MISIRSTLSWGQVYSWTDEQGNVHYGNKPPKGKKTEAVAAKLSRYNSKEMINRLNQATDAAKLAKAAKEKRAKAQEMEPKNNTANNSSMENKNVALDKPNSGIQKVTTSSGVKVESQMNDGVRILQALEKLEVGDISIKYDDDYNITTCSAIIKNIGNQTQDGIAVVFDFKDRSRVVADGQVKLEPGKEGKYFIPKDLLPFSLKRAFKQKDLVASGLDKNSIREKLTPKVTIGLE
ncbi:MAG: DUF4124 domain-containing protein [Deltaproteobacteria bacterium]|nr:DUF4124 domain-containing protein [Deltaproteobacteria bacterium]